MLFIHGPLFALPESALAAAAAAGDGLMIRADRAPSVRAVRSRNIEHEQKQKRAAAAAARGMAGKKGAFEMAALISAARSLVHVFVFARRDTRTLARAGSL
ncbi:Hypothetical predicted protein [Olea europaea subsp. europaea]|uniref:Secreted protein n=1 Tax=Olea europaea subsp. europaea TaxID=158383 RepID=A0A8S0SFZ7_OLEEU|nr:Hypothetical predicted protein [Olea europaea subsp. europaea]